MALAVTLPGAQAAVEVAAEEQDGVGLNRHLQHQRLECMIECINEVVVGVVPGAGLGGRRVRVDDVHGDGIGGAGGGAGAGAHRVRSGPEGGDDEVGGCVAVGMQFVLGQIRTGRP
jgi:hypothetical protein